MGKKWTAGEYGYKRYTDNTGVIIRIDSVYDDGTVRGGEFVSERQDGSVYSGGAWSGGRNENVYPLSEPGQILVARLFQAQRDMREAQAKQEELQKTAAALRLAITAVREAQATSPALTAAGGE